MNLYVAAIVIAFTTLLQSDFLPAILPKLSEFVPDFTFLIAFSWALLLRWQWSLPLAFVSGLFLDLANPATHFVGLNALLYTLSALLVSFARPKNQQELGITRAIPLTFGAALLYRLLLLLGQRLMGYNNFQLNLVTQVILPVAVLDAALMLVVYVTIRAVSQIGVPPE